MSGTRARTFLPWCVVLIAACGARGCGCKPRTLAVLTETQGVVERDYARSEGHWSAAKAGSAFLEGDGLRTRTNGNALLRVGEAGQAQLEADTTVRFRSALPGGEQAFTLEVSSGAASLLAGADGLGVRTRDGEARIAAASMLRVRLRQRSQSYEVMFGHASIPTKAGSRKELHKGEVYEVEIGLAEPTKHDAVPVRAAAALAPAVTAGNVAAGTTTATTTTTTTSGSGSGSATAGLPKTDEEPAAAEPVAREASAGTSGPAIGGGIDHADLVLRAGASVTIYDPSPPTAVGFDFHETCPEGAIVRAGTGKRAQVAHGKLQLNLALPAGTYGYDLVCEVAGAAQASRAANGTIYVQQKSGSDSLPRSAPRDTIDLDGRRYTVMFQNLPPAIDARWPKAPKYPRYTLHAQLANGKTLEWSSSTPSYVLKPGVVPEGESHMYFEANGQRTRDTTLVVKFDNAAPSASLRLPPVAGYARGEPIAIEGVALAGSSISVDGQSLALDPQHRFAGAVAVDPNARALAVRIEHPRTGVRFYIRRPGRAR